MKRQIGLCYILLVTLTLNIAGTVQAEEPAEWYWHYIPLDGRTYGIGLSRPTETRAAAWQGRLNFGHDLGTLGATLQRQQTLLDAHPQWYLATGLRVLHHLDDRPQRWCVFEDCDSIIGQWEGALFGRWTWGFTAKNFRLDVGYGAEFRVLDGNNVHENWSLNPTIDVALGWRL